MSQKPISPLRQRMLEDMSVRKFGEKTQHDYIRHIVTFTSFLKRSPDTATPEDIRRYQLHQAETRVGAPTVMTEWAHRPRAIDLEERARLRLGLLGPRAFAPEHEFAAHGVDGNERSRQEQPSASSCRP